MRYASHGFNILKKRTDVTKITNFVTVHHSTRSHPMSGVIITKKGFNRCDLLGLFIFMEEIWKDIQGFEGHYQVSNLGRVKSLARTRKSGYGSMSKVNERFLKSKIDRYGYVAYTLCKDNKMSYYTSHKLVATAFIINPNYYSQINHINGNKLDNSVENLEWCNNSHNMKEAYRLGLSKPRKSAENVLSKKVVMIKDGVVVKTFDSLTDAGAYCGVLKTAIGNCLKGRSKTCAGYEWMYYEDFKLAEREKALTV